MLNVGYRKIEVEVTTVTAVTAVTVAVAVEEKSLIFLIFRRTADRIIKFA